MRRWATVGVALTVLGVVAGCTAPPTPGPVDHGGEDDDLDQVVAAVRAASPDTEGTLWSDTTGNELPGTVDQWFLQTPRC